MSDSLALALALVVLVALAAAFQQLRDWLRRLEQALLLIRGDQEQTVRVLRALSAEGESPFPRQQNRGRAVENLGGLFGPP